jgi:DNA-binding NarL/FixJ family response regulator
MADITTVIIADDHPIFRQGLRHAIDRQVDFSVIGEAANGTDALRMIIELKPGIAVLDLDMPGIDGFAVVDKVRKRSVNVKTIILTMHKDDLHVSRAVDLGVSGYVIKDEAAYEIIKCMRTVLSGKEYFSPALTSVLLKRARPNSSERDRTGISELTPSEMQIVQMLADLHTNKHIANTLHVSVRTVENHHANICSKLGLHGSHALVKFAIEQKNTFDQSE